MLQSRSSCPVTSSKAWRCRSGGEGGTWACWGGQQHQARRCGGHGRQFRSASHRGTWQGRNQVRQPLQALPQRHPQPQSLAGDGGGGGNYGGASARHVAEFDGPGRWNRVWLLPTAVAVIAIWRWRSSSSQLHIESATGKLSIIVPALNEEGGLRACLRWLKVLEPPAHEIIVVDGGSSDSTVKIAEDEGVIVINAARGRCKQMNAGANKATGSLLCFVHADSQPPRELVSVVRSTLSRPQVVLGGFRTIIESDGRPLRGMTAHHLVKTYYLPLLMRPLSLLRGIRCLFGDQTMFCRTADFQHVGGFRPDLPIMEDVDLCIRMHMAGPTTMPGSKARQQRHYWSLRGKVCMVLKPPARTSGRRLSAWGPLHATFVHFVIGLSWYFGASPKQMHSIYHRMYTDSYR